MVIMPVSTCEAIALAGVEEFRTAGTSFEALAGYGIAARYLQTASEPERVMTVDAERGFFSMLGVEAMAGRTFRPDDPARNG